MLGPLEVAGAQVRGARLRALLIRLALDTDRVVTTGRLIDALWEDDPPGANALQALVSRLRRAVPEFTVAAHPAGYQLVLDRDQVDVFRFERLAAEGRAAADPRQAAADPRQAAPRCARPWPCGAARRWPTWPRPSSRRRPSPAWTSCG